MEGFRDTARDISMRSIHDYDLVGHGSFHASRIGQPHFSRGDRLMPRKPRAVAWDGDVKEAGTGDIYA
jgi:hypothetical protein